MGRDIGASIATVASSANPPSGQHHRLACRGEYKHARCVSMLDTMAPAYGLCWQGGAVAPYSSGVAGQHYRHLRQ